MSFMQPQAVRMKMLHVETTAGTELVPSDLVHLTPSAAELRQYLEGEPRVSASGDVDCERHEGFYARFSAPGYLDRTDWVGPEKTAKAALKSLAETHDVCETCFEACWDGEPCES